MRKQSVAIVATQDPEISFQLAATVDYPRGLTTQRQPERPELAKNCWITKQQISAYYQFSLRAIKNLTSSGVLPFSKSGNLLRFKPADCDRAIEKFEGANIYPDGPKRNQGGMVARNWRTKQQTADHFTCSCRSVGNLMRRRTLPFVKLGNLVRFDLAGMLCTMPHVQARPWLVGMARLFNTRAISRSVHLIEENTGKAGAAALHVPDHLRERIPPLNAEPAFAVVGIDPDDLRSPPLGIFLDSLQLVAGGELLMLSRHPYVGGPT
jgi:hypothetical protein